MSAKGLEARAGAQPAALPVAVGVLVFLIPVLALFSSGETVGTVASGAWILTFLVFLWSGFRLSQLLSRGSAALFSFFWWLFVYVFMGLAPTLQLRSGQFPSTTLNVPSQFVWPAAAVVAAGVLFWEAGALMARGGNRRSSGKSYTLSRPRVLCLCFIGALTAAYFWASVGIGSLGLNRSEFGGVRSAAWPDLAVSSIVFSLAVYLSLLGAHGLLALRELGFLGRFALPVAILLAALAISIGNPIGNARYVAGTVLIGVSVMFGVFATRSRTRLTFVGAIGGLLFVFPVADLFRRENFDSSRSGFFSEYVSSGDYDGFAQVVNSLAYVSSEGTTGGRQILGSAFFWLPRSIWPDKPRDTGVVVGEFRGYEFTNLSAPVWAELWVNGGVVALAVGMTLLGYIMSRVDQRVTAAFEGAADPYWRVVGAVLPVYMIIVLRGSLLQATGGLVVLVAASLFMRSASGPSETSLSVRR